MDSPRSEKITTRFSTPVSDLDDHRHQSPIAPANAAQQSPVQAVRHPSDRNAAAPECRTELLAPNSADQNALPISKDFEQAVTDGEQSDDGDNIPQVYLEGNPLAPRQARKIRYQPAEGGDRGRDRENSPSSSRSSSPPNSVDAFAEPRRRERANTFGSKAPSDLNFQGARRISNASQRRRPTFGSGSVRPSDLKDSDRPEEDVCFPQPEEPTKTFAIDYEEIEEFVMESKKSRLNGFPRREHSFSSHTGRKSPKPGLTQVASIGDEFADPAKLEGLLPCENEVSVGAKSTDLTEKSSGPEQGLNVHEQNRISFFSSEIEQTIHAPELGDLVLPGESFRDLFELPIESGAWWLDVYSPTVAELDMFQKAFGIHRLTAEDIERQEIREKVELFQKYYFVCFRSFYQMDETSEDFLEPVNLYMVVFREGILTFSYAPSPHAAEVRKRIGKLRDYINLTADWICYALVDNIVDSFGPVIRKIEIETDQIEDQVFVARPDDFSSLLRQIGICRKKVMSLMRLLGGKADVIKGFAKRCNEQYSVTPRGEIGLYLGDIQDHVVTMMSNLGHAEKMLSRCHSNYLAQLSVDSLFQGNQTNKALSKITLIATVLVPLNLVSGLFGMNVPVPGGVNPGSLTWFFGIIGFFGLVVVTSGILARRWRYI